MAHPRSDDNPATVLRSTPRTGPLERGRTSGSSSRAPKRRSHGGDPEGNLAMPSHIRASIAALLGLGLTSGCVQWDTAQAVRTDLARPLASDAPMLSNDRLVFPGPGPGPGYGPVPAPGPEKPPVDAVHLAGAEATVEP